jgi:hypothetical protein
LGSCCAHAVALRDFISASKLRFAACICCASRDMAGASLAVVTVGAVGLAAVETVAGRDGVMACAWRTAVTAARRPGVPRGSVWALASAIAKGVSTGDAVTKDAEASDGAGGCAV